MSSSASSNSIGTVANVVFGITATAIGIVTVWQGHRVWKMWREHAHDQDNVAPDIELNPHSITSIPTSPEAPERREVVAGSASSANQVGDVADLAHGHLSGRRHEVEPILPTTVGAEASLSPPLVRGARNDGSEFPTGHDDNPQPVLTDGERREPRLAAGDHV